MIVQIPAHAIHRWQQRVNDVSMTEARQQMEAFLVGASAEGKPRGWMKDDHRREWGLRRHGLNANHLAPLGYAYNDELGGVCVVLAMTDPPFVVTVVTREMRRERRQRFSFVIQAERRHGRLRRRIQ
jgi:hypothetical protein